MNAINLYIVLTHILYQKFELFWMKVKIWVVWERRPEDNSNHINQFKQYLVNDLVTSLDIINSVTLPQPKPNYRSTCSLLLLLVLKSSFTGIINNQIYYRYLVNNYLTVTVYRHKQPELVGYSMRLVHESIIKTLICLRWTLGAMQS